MDIETNYVSVQGLKSLKGGLKNMLTSRLFSRETVLESPYSEDSAGSSQRNLPDTYFQRSLSNFVASELPTSAICLPRIEPLFLRTH